LALGAEAQVMQQEFTKLESKMIVKNIMTVDLEDYYCDLPFSTWYKHKSEIINPTRMLLKLFEEYNVHATFFTVGYVAERHPELIEEVKSKGHEIASHGYAHLDLRKTDKEAFEADLTKSLDILKKTSGDKVLGFRAPYFSINKENFWIFDIMRKYLQYDSSVFPVRPHYGLPQAPRSIYKMSDKNPLKEDTNSNFVELPLTTLQLPCIGNLPVAGGFHMRILPFRLVKTALKMFNKSGSPAIFYIHPGDIDPAFPHDQAPWYYYWGVNGALQKFSSILSEFRFSSAREVLSFQ
jgi:polysaccharide deacetylase family protein (PEP-CTERM system associated)